uniref:Uncharacterized protein n=1 Tax=Rhizophora mucronata TaxID=61149 RepID=A0A2P2MUB4_RHIMU
MFLLRIIQLPLLGFSHFCDLEIEQLS